VETKSLKLYFLAYREYGGFMETITGNILKDFVEVCQPKWCLVSAKFATRGGVDLTVRVPYTAIYPPTKDAAHG
jgi:7-cyano-7-deazaguanine reductase